MSDLSLGVDENTLKCDININNSNLPGSENRFSPDYDKISQQSPLSTLSQGQETINTIRIEASEYAKGISELMDDIRMRIKDLDAEIEKYCTVRKCLQDEYDQLASAYHSLQQFFYK